MAMARLLHHRFTPYLLSQFFQGKDILNHVVEYRVKRVLLGYFSVRTT